MYQSVLQRVAVCCSVLQRVVACCSVLQCVTVYYSLQNIGSKTEGDELKVYQSVLQCVAVCCSVLQYVHLLFALALATI